LKLASDPLFIGQLVWGDRWKCFIDMGSNSSLTEADVRQTLNQALTDPFFLEAGEGFRSGDSPKINPSVFI